MFSVRADRKWQNESQFDFKYAEVHPALRTDIRLPYSPQQVCQSGQHPAGPGCGRNGTCWQFQITGEAETQKKSFQKNFWPLQSSLHYSESKISWIKRAITVECKWITRGYLMSHSLVTLLHLLHTSFSSIRIRLSSPITQTEKCIHS